MGVIQISRQTQVFLSRTMLDFGFLAIDIALILGLDFDLLGDLRINGAGACAGQSHQTGIADLGASEQI